MKFLIVWRLELSLTSRGMLEAVLRMPEYAAPLEAQGKIHSRYHVVGQHGGAWIFDVESHEELERLLAGSPVYNFAHYEVFPLAEMGRAAQAGRGAGGDRGGGDPGR